MFRWENFGEFIDNHQFAKVSPTRILHHAVYLSHIKLLPYPVRKYSLTNYCVGIKHSKLKIENVDTVEDIIMSTEWLDFFNGLTKGTSVPRICMRYCGDDRDTREETVYD